MTARDSVCPYGVYNMMTNGYSSLEIFHMYLYINMSIYISVSFVDNGNAQSVPPRRTIVPKMFSGILLRRSFCVDECHKNILPLTFDLRVPFEIGVQ